MLRKILVVDDSFINRRILTEILSHDYEVLEAENGREALDIIYSGNVAISAVLLDLYMPVMNGFEVLGQLRQNKETAHIPVIVTTTDTDRDTEVNALALGANDFAIKPYNPEIIRRRLWNLINMRENAVIVNATRIDALTGLAGRAAFFDWVGEAVGSKEPGAFVLECFDIDGFKVVNDRYGNAKGDEILKFIADIFGRVIDSVGGHACRMTADKFAAVYPVEFMNSQELADMYRDMERLDGSILPVTMSIGRYIIDDKSLSPSAMYDRASIAKQSVKERYGTNAAVYDEKMREKIIKEREIVSEMNKALENGEFEVWLQPQYNHSSGALIGAEALVRWRHPKRGLISPAEFIPVFEHNGFIYELDKYVWRRTCELLRKWERDGRKPLPVSVNISRYDILRDDLIKILTNLLTEFSLSCEMLRLEITETAFATSADRIITVVQELIEHGFTVEIDDFGSGYSSLNTLKDVPAQVVKLDMRFLEGKHNSTRGGNIIESIVRMTKWLGMSVIAEGVEQKTQADYLLSIGCDYIQGYLYSPPITAEEFEKLAIICESENMRIDITAAEALENNTFWDPASMDTLIFNTFIGGACIYEYYKGNIELLRATRKFAKIVGNTAMSVEDALKIKWSEHLNEKDAETIADALKKSAQTHDEVTVEVVFRNLPGCPKKTYLRSTVRVIAVAGDRMLVYCTNENISAQHEAEKKKYKAEKMERIVAERLRVIMSNLGSGVTAVAMRGHCDIEYIFSNDRFFEILGYTREQYSESFTNTYGPIAEADRAWVIEKIENIAKTYIPVSLEYRALRRDGREIWLRQRITCTRLENVKETVLLSIIDDITLEKQMTLRLYEADNQLQAIMNNVGGAVSAATLDNGVSTYIYVNDGYYGLFGYTKEQFEAEVPHGLFDIICPEDITAIEKSAKETEKGGTAELNFRVTKRDGTIIWVRGNSTACRIDGVDGAVHVAVMRDVTKEIEAQREISLLNKNMTDLMNDTPGGFARMGISPSGRTYMIYANDGFCGLLGMTREEVSEAYAYNIIDFICPSDLPIFLSALREAPANGGRIKANYKLRKKDGEYIPVQTFGRVTMDEDGERYLNAYYTDISEKEKDGSYAGDAVTYLLKTIMESSVDLSFAMDKDLKYICCSKPYVKFVGLKNEKELLGKTDYDLFSPELAEKLVNDDKEFLKSGKTFTERLTVIQNDDGIPQYINMCEYIIKNSRGDILGIYGVGRDITDLKTASEHLRMFNETSLCATAMFEFSPDRMRTLYSSDGFYRFSGYDKDEYKRFVAGDAMFLIFEEDRAGLAEAVEKLRRDGVPIDTVYRCKKKDGGISWFNLHCVVSERRGDTVIANAVQFDITKVKEAEEEARKNIRWFKLSTKLVNDSSMAVYVSDINTYQILYANYRCARISGRPLAESHKAKCYKYLKGRDTPCEDCYMKDSTPDKYIEREFTGAPSGRHYMTRGKIIDWDGKPALVEYISDETNRINLNQKLQAGQRAMEMASRNSGISFWHYDIDEKILSFEDYSHTNYGGYPKKFENMPYSMLNAGFVHGDDAAEFLRMHTEMDNDAESAECTVRVLNPEANKYIWHHIVYTRLHDEYYKTRNAIGFAADVNLQQEIKTRYEHEKQLRRELAGVSDYYLEINLTTKTIEEYYTKHADKNVIVTPVSANSTLREVFYTQIHPADRADVKENFSVDGLLAHYLNGDGVFDRTYRYVLPDGSTRWINSSATILKKPGSGDIVSFISCRDIDIEKKNQMALDSIIDEEADMVILVNIRRQKARFVTLKSTLGENKNTEDTDYLTLMKDSTKYLTDKEDEEAYRRFFAIPSLVKELENSPSVTLMFKVRTPDGGIARKRTLAYYLDETHEDIVLSMRDVTGMYEEEQRQKQAMKTAMDSANEANRAKSEFLSRMSHDMRTPMNAIIGMVNLAQTEENPQRIAEYLENINTSSHFLLGLLGDVLDLNKIESGNIELNETAYSLDEFERGIKSVITPHMNGKNIDFGFENRTNLNGIIIDRLRFNQIFFNLLSNAAKYTQSGGRVEFIIEPLPDREGKRGMKCIVRDNGRGMKREFLDKAFEPFTQENPDFSGCTTGSGLGLAIVKNLVDIMGGSISVRSEVGVGSEFEVELFVREATDIYSGAKMKTTDYSALNGLEILLVDDNELNVIISQKLLELNGAVITVAENGLEALKKFEASEKGHFKVVLMDIRMPVMDGIEATERIRALDRADAKTVPIIAMTADAFVGDANKTTRAGMNAHVTKPIEPALLYETIIKLIKN